MMASKDCSTHLWVCAGQPPLESESGVRFCGGVHRRQRIRVQTGVGPACGDLGPRCSEGESGTGFNGLTTGKAARLCTRWWPMAPVSLCSVWVHRATVTATAIRVCLSSGSFQPVMSSSPPAQLRRVSGLGSTAGLWGCPVSEDVGVSGVRPLMRPGCPVRSWRTRRFRVDTSCGEVYSQV